MAASYKPILLRCLLDTVDKDGAVPVANLTLAFSDSYLARKAAGKLVEKPSARMARVKELSEGESSKSSSKCNSESLPSGVSWTMGGIWRGCVSRGLSD